MPSPKQLAKALAYRGEIRNTPQNSFLGGVANFLAPVSEFADQYKISDRIPFLGGMSAADLTGLKGAQSLVNDMSYGKSPISGASLQTAKVDPRVLDLAGVTGAMMPIGKALGKAALRNVAEQVQNKTGILGRNVIDPRQQIITYHGSPHTFPPTANNPLGEFDPMKVGTGEGAQAYGVGAGYLAEAPAVAKGYRQTEGMYKRVTGGMTNKEEFIADHLSQGRPETSILDLYAQKYGGSFDDAMKDLINVKQMYGTGNLYKVDLPDEHVAKMLDWDKPLSEQHPDVQAAVKQLHGKDALGRPVDAMPIDEDTRGQLLYQALQAGRSQKLASQALSDAGVPGIRYLDAASRDAGKGTSNFVVFDPKHMNILERNGVGGAMMQRPKTEFEILHDTAQRNAALPKEQGGLGLPANNTYIDRANVMYPTDAYHGSNLPIQQIDPAMLGSSTGAKSAKQAFWAVDNPTVARGYAEYAANEAPVAKILKDVEFQGKVAQRTGNWDKYESLLTKAEELESANQANPLNGQNIMPLRINTNNSSVMDAGGNSFPYAENDINQFLRQSKYAGNDVAQIKNLDDAVGRVDLPANHYAVFNPANIRSRFAAFDPMRRHEADILAGVGVGGMLDPQAIAEALRQQDRK